MTTRLRTVTPRNCSGLKSRDWLQAIGTNWTSGVSVFAQHPHGSQVAAHQRPLPYAAMPQDATISTRWTRTRPRSAGCHSPLPSLPSAIARLLPRRHALAPAPDRALRRDGRHGHDDDPGRALAARYGCPVDILSSGSWTVPLLAGQPDVGDDLPPEEPLAALPAEQGTAGAGRRPCASAAPARPGTATPTTSAWHCCSRAGFGPELICRRTPDCRCSTASTWSTTGSASRARPRPPRAAGIGRGLRGSRSATAGAAAETAEELDRWLAERNLLGRQLLLVQPGNKRTMRRGLRRRPSNTKWWPETRWAAVLQALAQHASAGGDPDARRAAGARPERADHRAGRTFATRSTSPATCRSRGCWPCSRGPAP